MSDRVDVIALKPISLGGVSYAPGDRISMAEARVRQYEAIARYRGAVIERADPAAPPAPKPAPSALARLAKVIVKPADPPARVAAVVNADDQAAPKPARYRHRRLKAEG